MLQILCCINMIAKKWIATCNSFFGYHIDAGFAQASNTTVMSYTKYFGNYTVKSYIWEQNKIFIDRKIFCEQVTGFEISNCPWGKWIVKITCPNVPFTCPQQIRLVLETRSHPTVDCWYFTSLTVIFSCLRWSDGWNFEPGYCSIYLLCDKPLLNSLVPH